MKLKDALHTAARRYVMERIDLLTSQIPPDIRVWTDPAREAAGRRSVLLDVLIQVETATPHPPGSAENVRRWLIDAAFSASEARRRAARAEPHTYVGEPTPGRLDIERDEARRFEQYILGLSDSELLSVEPLPYRRTLSVRERDSLLQQLGARWELGLGLWEAPEGGDEDPAKIRLTRLFVMGENVRAGVQKAMYRLGTTHLWRLGTSSLGWVPSSEMDLEVFEPGFNGGNDMYWTSGSMFWVIFDTHEDLIIVLGEDLVSGIRHFVPYWREGLWRGYPTTPQSAAGEEGVKREA